MAYKVTVKGGSHPTLVDYACEKCGEMQIDVFYHGRDAVEKQVDCPCGSKADKIISNRNFIHPSHSGMYGKFHDGLGCVVDDYAHKKRLMKQQGVMEGADPVGGSRNHWKPTPDRPAPIPGSHWTDKPGEYEL